MINVLVQGIVPDISRLKKSLEPLEVNIEDKSISKITAGAAGIISDYDLLAFDFESPLYIHSKKLMQLKTFLKTGRGILIIVLRQYSEIGLATENGESRIVNNHELLIELFKEAGYDDPNFKFEPNPSFKLGVTRQGKNCLIKEHLEQNSLDVHVVIPNDMELPVIPLAIDTENNIAAFSISPFNNQIFVVPPMTKDEYIVLLHGVINKMKESKMSLVDIPGWVFDYSIPSLEDIKIEINKTEGKKEKIDKKLENLRSQQKNLENIRNILLYGNGDLLHEMVISVLKDIGIKAEKGPQGYHDIEFIKDKKHFVCEVKGKGKSIGKDDIRQLSEWKENYEVEKEVIAKGIFIANSWRKLPLEERNTKNKLNFSDNISKIVTLRKFCLITTSQIYAIYCQWKQNPDVFDVSKLIRELYSTTGEYSKYNKLMKIE